MVGNNLKERGEKPLNTVRSSTMFASPWHTSLPLQPNNHNFVLPFTITVLGLILVWKINEHSIGICIQYNVYIIHCILPFDKVHI